MIELLIVMLHGFAVGFLASFLIGWWRARREQRRWLETYARELGLEPRFLESTKALRRRLAAHLAWPPFGRRDERALCATCGRAHLQGAEHRTTTSRAREPSASTWRRG